MRSTYCPSPIFFVASATRRSCTLFSISSFSRRRYFPKIVIPAQTGISMNRHGILPSRECTGMTGMHGDDRPMRNQRCVFATVCYLICSVYFRCKSTGFQKPTKNTPSVFQPGVHDGCVQHKKRQKINCRLLFRYRLRRLATRPPNPSRARLPGAGTTPVKPEK